MTRDNLNEIAAQVYLDFFNDFYTAISESNVSGVKRGLRLVNPHELVKCVHSNDDSSSLSIAQNYILLNSDFETSNFYMNPLLTCLATNQLDSLQALLEEGVTLRELPEKIITKEKGLTLWQAVAKCKRSFTDYKKCIDLFTRYGKDINDLDCSGHAPLHIAVDQDNKKNGKSSFNITYY
ncbi:hypothetical protein Noda2021_05060 [Candidatus Dependentiae bacterium Noda2021]|nr:hypothetical protein Noda2021_05060 [Candidatus Dependentiae bacterium Noda2021]